MKWSEGGERKKKKGIFCDQHLTQLKPLQIPKRVGIDDAINNFSLLSLLS
jgi:hypothetical protein